MSLKARLEALRGGPADPHADPQLTPAYAIAALTTVVGLLVTQGLITNETGKIIGGIASVLVPVVFAVVHALVKAQAHKARLAFRPAQVPPPGGGQPPVRVAPPPDLRGFGEK